MKRITKHLVVISFDGLSTLDFEYINSLPNFKNFINEASYCKVDGRILEEIFHNR